MQCKRRRFLELTGATAGLTTTTVVSAQESPTVEMVTEDGDYYFDPIGLHVEPGSTVTFENASGTHNSVAYSDRIPDGASEWQTPLGETAEHTFETPGTYDYYCQPHQSFGMVGRIVVGEPGGPAQGSQPPEGSVPESSNIVDAGAISYAEFAGQGPGGGGDTDPTTALIGTGILGGMAALATIVYWLANSEGERYRVGSAAWKRRMGRE